jgi:uncharacterized membrane protein YgaE (UPF0421/DUF939 family)
VESVVVIFLFLLSSTALAVDPVPAVGTTLSLAALIEALVQLFAGVAQHPVASGVGVSIVGTFFSVIWFFISGKFTAWQQKSAQNTTQANEQSFVQNQTNQNQEDNNQDNQGRKNLE